MRFWVLPHSGIFCLLEMDKLEENQINNTSSLQIFHFLNRITDKYLLLDYNQKVLATVLVF